MTVAVTVTGSLCQEKLQVLTMAMHTQNEVGAVFTMQVGSNLYGTCIWGLMVSCVVMSLPQEKVVRSVVNVKECASEWYRLGIELGYTDGLIRERTSGITSEQGKLQALIQTKANEHGEKGAVEALLDACDRIIPLATVAVVKDLRIKYIGTGKVLAICYPIWFSALYVCGVL